ncbi:MAG TPA: ATP-binding protein, partial [Gemmatimonadales bacterium]|nr:ATP-binding protein [Gemmatimonadales bacterium]
SEEVERTHRLTVGLDVPEQAVPLRWDAALAAYRITQEALRNVARHSGCREAAVALDLEDGYVRLRIEDRGCGFDADGPGPGLGLVAMQERAVLAGGEFDLRSEKGQGTRIEVSFPLAGA